MKEIVRLVTAGSVDDGKSTLLGRLLYETDNIYQAHYEDIVAQSQQNGDEYVNLALLTDGLSDEVQQGITIDVAYKYFETDSKKFILGDSPGHVEYTRNMVTAASHAQVALILCDASKGLTEQSRRHAFICSLMGISHVVFCINKFDLVDYREEVFVQFKQEWKNFCVKLGFRDMSFIPTSALHGDNVTQRSAQTPRYKGPTLLEKLESVEISSDRNLIDARLAIQHIIHPKSTTHTHFRSYAGQVAGGIFKPGDKVIVLPTQQTTTIDTLFLGEEEVQEAYPPLSVSMTLQDDVDVSRGSLIAKPNNQPKQTTELECMLCRLDKQAFVPGKKYILQHTTNKMRCMITNVQYVIDMNTLHKDESVDGLDVNMIGRVTLKTIQPLYYDRYEHNKQMGSFILVDETTFNTVAAGVVK